MDRKRDGLRVLVTRFRGKRSRLIKNHGQKFTLRLLQTLGKRGTVTPMCHCDEDQKQCHPHILADVLRHKV